MILSSKNWLIRHLRFILPLLFLGAFNPLIAQTTVEGANLGLFTPEELIYQVFLGSGIEIVDVVHTGNDASVGFFSNAIDDIRISEGILMTSGRATLAQDPNNAMGTTQQWNMPGTDADLDPIASGNLFDMSIYEITFVPAGDSIRFNYVFASEEYPEYACTGFNDVFGFFLTGPNPAGGNYMGDNIALVPDPADPTGQTFTNIPVTINNINGNGLDVAGGCNFDFGNYYQEIPTGGTPTYDAYLDVFVALAEVIPCEEYTIKLAVADVGDDQFDTGIFLEGKSFGGGVPIVETLTVGLDGVIAEGCAEGSLVFTLPFESDAPVSFSFDVFGDAIEGVDFDIAQTSFTITPPATSVSIPIDVFEDGLVEGTEQIGIGIDLTDCRRDSFYFFVEDNQLVQPDLPEFVSNCSGPVQLDGNLNIDLPEPDSFFNFNSATIPIIPDNNPPPPGTILPLSSEIQVFGVQPLELQADMIAEVCFNIDKPFFVGDLDIYLFSPGGSFIELTTDNGAGGMDYIETCFSPTATMAINDFPQGQAPATEAPFTGYWLPESSFDNLYGSDANGTWSLVLKNDSAIPPGTLLNWRIVFLNNYEINYSWSPAAGLTCTDCPDPIADPMTETTYTLSVTDIYGCEVLDSVTVNQGLLADPVLIDSVSCFGGADGIGTFTITEAGTPPYQIEWFDSLTDSIHAGLAAGIYEVSFTDAFGCEGVEEVTILQPDAALSLMTSVVDLCPDNSGMGEVTVTPMGGTPNYTYQWGAAAGSVQTQTVSNLGQGQYDVTVTDAKGCSEIGMASITVADPITLVLIGDTLTCGGAPVPMLTVMASGGNGGFTYEWSDGLGTDSIATNVAPGNYMVTVTDANNCFEILNVNVINPGNITLDLTLQDPLCPGQESGTAQINSASLEGVNVPLTDLTIAWSAGVGTATSRLSLPGDTDITITITDANGCESDSTFQLEDPPSFSINLMNNSPVSCFGESNGSLEITLTGGVGPLTHNWLELTQTDLVVTDLPAGIYNLEVLDGGTGCPAEDTSFVVTEPDQFVIIDTTGYAGCESQASGFASLAITGGTPPMNINWSNGQSGPMLQNVFPGTYSYALEDGNGCDTSGIILVPIPDSVIIKTTAPKLVCRYYTNGVLTINVDGGSPPYTYSMDGINFISNPVFVGLGWGFHEVWVRDALGCEYFYDNAFVDGPPPFRVNIQPDSLEITLGEEPPLNIDILNGQGFPQLWDWEWALGDTTYLSCDDCRMPIVEGLTDERTFKLRITDEAGCFHEDDLRIRLTKPRIFQVPTGFTPNGDNFNDLLLTHGDEDSMVELFRVYDRWGTLVYENGEFMTGNAIEAWDGTYRGEALPPGVFVWYATVKYIDDQVIQYKGETTLIR